MRARLGRVARGERVDQPVEEVFAGEPLLEEVVQAHGSGALLEAAAAHDVCVKERAEVRREGESRLLGDGWWRGVRLEQGR